MDISTLIILIIAVLIIIYRIKTWNDVNGQADEKEILKPKDSIKKEEVTISSKKKPKTDESATIAKDSVIGVKYRKKYNKDIAKNQVLVACVLAKEVSGKALEFKSQPKRGIATFVVLVDNTDDRAVGVVLEQQKEAVTLVKSFDVKLGTNGQFKVPTSFSKAQAVSLDSMKEKSFAINNFLGHDENIYSIDEVFLELL